MDSAKRKRLEAAGWKLGEAADFLKMNDKERQTLEARVKRARRPGGNVNRVPETAPETF